MQPNMTFLESFKSLLSTGAGLVILLLLSLAFLSTLLLNSNESARRFISGMVPFVQPRDAKGNPVKRSPGQWVGMMVIIGILIALIVV